MAIHREIWEISVLKLTDNISSNAQLVAQRCADGWILVQIVTFFPGNHQAFFHRQVDQLAEFENKNHHSALKSLPPISPQSVLKKPLARQVEQ